MESPLGKDSVQHQPSFDLNENLKTAYDKGEKRLAQPWSPNNCTSQVTSYNLMSADEQADAFHTQRFSEEGGFSTLRDFQLNFNAIKDEKQR